MALPVTLLRFTGVWGLEGPEHRLSYSHLFGLVASSFVCLLACFCVLILKACLSTLYVGLFFVGEVLDPQTIQSGKCGSTGIFRRLYEDVQRQCIAFLASA